MKQVPLLLKPLVVKAPSALAHERHLTKVTNEGRPQATRACPRPCDFALRSCRLFAQLTSEIVIISALGRVCSRLSSGPRALGRPGNLQGSLQDEHAGEEVRFEVLSLEASADCKCKETRGHARRSPHTAPESSRLRLVDYPCPCVVLTRTIETRREANHPVFTSRWTGERAANAVEAGRCKQGSQELGQATWACVFPVSCSLVPSDSTYGHELKDQIGRNF